MYRQEYQMVVTVPTADANDPNWPNKRIQFDTSEWLQQLQYIKIDDHYILNTQYTPIANLDDFGITLKLQNALNGSDKRLPALYGLAEMDAQKFKDLMRGKIKCEYLRTTFDAETLKPVNDYLKISGMNLRQKEKYLKQVMMGIFCGHLIILSTKQAIGITQIRLRIPIEITRMVRL